MAGSRDAPAESRIAAEEADVVSGCLMGDSPLTEAGRDGRKSDTCGNGIVFAFLLPFLLPLSVIHETEGRQRKLDAWVSGCAYPNIPSSRGFLIQR